MKKRRAMDKKIILIVEDDKDIAAGLSVRLRANGYATVCATDAGSGIDAALTEHPDLILLDLGLPDDNGFVMMRRMEAMAPLWSIPVIVMSGRSPQVYKDPALIAGAKGYLEKPIENDQLLAAVRKAVPS
ncbi:MAG: response regulator [Deltaproteobacteria bacterium]|nr:response regulator [Deltaproteobacteria bacterium]